MKLTDLEPRWIHPNVLVFLCPHCHDSRKFLLSCKDVPMSLSEQIELFETLDGWKEEFEIVPCKKETSWTFSRRRSYEDMTITPSIDASASGHWHGFITNGEIR